MSKITAKHFLNTNLKPYIINGIKHYSIYILLVAYRQNTKVKSITFDEYYNEDFFNEIISSNDDYDKNLINNEINTIIIITEISVKELGGFDTAFITSFFKFSNTININSSIKLENEFMSKLNGYINDFDKYFNYIGKYDLYKDFSEYDFNRNIITTSLFDFYNYENQNKIRDHIKKHNKEIKNIDDFISELNTALFYNSLNRFKHYISKTKNSFLIEKYNTVFDRLLSINETFRKNNKGRRFLDW